MTRRELLDELQRMLNLRDEELSEGQTLDGLPEWDSLAVLGVISLFDKRFGVVLSPSKLSSCETIGSVIDLVGDRMTS